MVSVWFHGLQQTAMKKV